MAELAVFFPGIGYTADKPLMHYSRRIALSEGYEIRLLPYSGFPSNVKGDRAKMAESFRIALRQAEEMLSDTDFAAYEDVLFVGKSIGTIAAAKIASESKASDRIRLILYTPLEETFRFSFGKSIAFTGTDDPWTGGKNSRIPELCRDRQIPCTVIQGGNHSLESPDLQEDLRNMRIIMEASEDFIRNAR